MKIVPPKTSALLIAGVALFAFEAATVHAQETSPPASAETPTNPLPDNSAPTTAVSDTKLNQFAEAYVAVQAIQKDAATQPSTAQNPQATQTLMMNAIKTSGLQLDEFNQIAQLMNSDMQLRSKIAEKVQQRGGS